MACRIGRAKPWLRHSKSHDREGRGGSSVGAMPNTDQGNAPNPLRVPGKRSVNQVGRSFFNSICKMRTPPTGVVV
jgi:hypothetical protein